jgi:hypothetical protein
MTGKAAGSPAHWRYAGDGELPGANGTGPANAKRLWTRDASSVRCPKRTVPAAVHDAQLTPSCLYKMYDKRGPLRLTKYILTTSGLAWEATRGHRRVSPD